MSNQQSFQDAIDRVVAMPSDRQLGDRVRNLGLNVVNVMWEDTARTPGSAWGANITDMTLQVRDPARRDRKHLLPVIRYPNFTDKTADVPFDQIKLKVGNEKGQDLQVVTLREYLTNLSNYVSDRRKYHAENQSLVTDSDTHVLVSAQACFLPIPQQGKCSFNPVLFNYQSRSESPAVLAILISTEGTSATIIDNAHDKASWGQNIYFNNSGQKTTLTGERLSDFKENQAQAIAQTQGVSLEEARSQVTVAQDINMVMVVQVPLKHKPLEYGGMDFMLSVPVPCAMAGGEMTRSRLKSDVEDAAIGHGEDEGEHLELGGHKLERDDRFPIRVTVQFYKATSNGVVDEEDLENVRHCIEAAYSSADYIGSLVVGTLEKGALGMGEARPTQPAPLPEAVLSPPKDYLKVVNPFAPNQNPTTGEKN
ncbi:hypothetical protein H6F67_22495 [Microcoleus sp. FACHB-1515]|uniref:hypothetical protein n=1 Tax=Cyanophyceae TaxID=3028117 RepID=UPI0016893334|nr:hypothetical protein [Microcoleus sp. FACHB-1515]MBD2092623.1 hypothetical protein [Microcoleus sp. FACHB-1515]